MRVCRGDGGRHTSCLVEQAKILVTEAEENNWNHDKFEVGAVAHVQHVQRYHGVVSCAPGGAVPEGAGRRQTSFDARCCLLGSGLSDNTQGRVPVTSLLSMPAMADQNELLVVQTILRLYERLGRDEDPRDAYFLLRTEGRGERYGRTPRRSHNLATPFCARALRRSQVAYGNCARGASNR